MKIISMHSPLAKNTAQRLLTLSSLSLGDNVEEIVVHWQEKLFSQVQVQASWFEVRTSRISSNVSLSLNAQLLPHRPTVCCSVCSE